jgi:hypothetical protein
MFNQVGFFTVDHHMRPDPVPMFVCYPRDRLRSVPLVAICATGLDLDHGVSSAPPAAIRTMSRDPGYELASAPSAAICAISRDLLGDSQENETK